MKNPNAAIEKQSPREMHLLMHRLAQWFGVSPNHLSAWSIKTFLGFLIVTLPAYLLALHYHYSSEGNLLSSTIAGSFGALLSWKWLKRDKAPSSLAVTLGLVALCASIYFVMPTHLNLLYALVVTSAFASFIVQQSPESSKEHGRTELLNLLSPFSSGNMITILQKTLFLWAFLAFIAHMLFRVIHLQALILLPFLAIAVSCSAVQNSKADKEQP